MRAGRAGRQDMETAWARALALLPDGRAAPPPGAGAAGSSAPSSATPRRRCAPTAPPRDCSRPTPTRDLRADVCSGWPGATRSPATGSDFEGCWRGGRGSCDVGPAARGRHRGDPDAGPDPAGPVRRAVAVVADAAGRRGQAARRAGPGYGVCINAACALACARRPGGGTRAGRPGASTRRGRRCSLKMPGRAGAHPGPARPARRGGRAADQVQAVGRPARRPDLAATATHDRGLVALAAGQVRRGGRAARAALDAGAAVSRVTAGLARAEALALAGDATRRRAAAPRRAPRAGRPRPTSRGPWSHGSPGCRR